MKLLINIFPHFYPNILEATSFSFTLFRFFRGIDRTDRFSFTVDARLSEVRGGSLLVYNFPMLLFFSELILSFMESILSFESLRYLLNSDLFINTLNSFVKLMSNHRHSDPVI